MTLRTAFLALLSLFTAIAGGQSPQHHQIIEELIEELMVSHIPDADPETVYDDLLHYLLFPLDINQAGESELSGLWFLDGLQISNLLSYRRTSGAIMSIYELLYVDGFTHDDLRRLQPFVRVGETAGTRSVPPLSVLKDGRHQYYMRMQQVMEEQAGFKPISDSALVRSPNSRYLGSPLKIYNRYQFEYGRQVQAGLVAEKDQGEEFFRGSNSRGFDYYSAHLQINDLGRIKTLAVGDYQASFGQGLVLWSGLAFSKSANTLNIRKNARGIQKYSSTDENMFFRGVGITGRILDRTEGSIFLSRKKIDAGVSLRCPRGSILEVSSLRTTGLHATPSQVEGKNVLGETVVGGNIDFNHELFRLGATFVALHYDAVLNPPERIYNGFEFRGDRNLNGGIDFQAALGKVRFFGEAAVSRSGGTAVVSGAMANLSPRLSLSALFRNYSRDYHAWFSNGFRENTRTANERGIYWGMLMQLARQVKLSAYVDLYSFPWLRYSAYAPSAGTEWFLQLDYNHSRNLHMYLNVRHKEMPVNSPADGSITRQLFDSGTSRIRYHVNYQVSREVELRTRTEFSQFMREDISPERGILLYQDVLWKPRQMPLSLVYRLALFETESYNARFYAYENDVLYAFSIPAYYDRGYRTYLLAQWNATDMVDIWVRFAVTRLPGRETIGSGLNMIDGDKRSELKAQVRLRF